MLRVKKTDSLKTIYAKARKAFTAADLARYTDLDEVGVPGEQVLEELKAIHKEELRRMPRKKKRA